MECGRIRFVMLAALSAIGWISMAVAESERPSYNDEFRLVNVLFACLKKEFPEINGNFDVRTPTAFDQNSGRNFSFDGLAWIDTKTKAPICPRTDTASATLMNVLFFECVKKKFPSVDYVSGQPDTAFDPKSGRRFSFDRASWIDTRTEELICPEGEIPSDIRLKRDIIRLTDLSHGVNLYRYRYNWSEQFVVGVLAQEVAEIVPDAVMLGPDGYLKVNYARLGLRLQIWDEWIGLHGRAVHCPCSVDGH